MNARVQRFASQREPNQRGSVQNWNRRLIMNPIFVAAIIIGGLIVLFLFFYWPTKAPREGGRPDHLEPRELTGEEQHKHRELP